MCLLKRCFAMGTIALVMSMSTAVEAAPITTLFNTGVDSSGVPLAAGLEDLNWEITAFVEIDNSTPVPIPATGPFVPTTPPGPWLNDAADANGDVPSNSRWITPTVSGQNVPAGFIDFELLFDLSAFDASTAVIGGSFASDNTVSDVLVNGISTGDSGSNFLTWVGFSIDPTLLLPGVNSIVFVSNNQSAVGDPSPGGLRVDFDNPQANAIPEPSSILLTAFGLLGLAGFRRRRHSK